MHLRLGQAARHDAQDQTSRHSQCRCRFHAQSDRIQSNPHSQTAGGVARVRSQREKLLPASEHTLTAQPSDPAKDGKCATFQILQQTARGQGYRRIARNALVSKSDRCGSAERPGRGHGPALDIPARLAYLPSLTIILDLRTFIGGGIPMMRDELVGSVVLGAMAALISMLVWGRSLVDLIAAGT